ncbi:MAG: hypothetical protein CMJ18_20400 [Phycisphaeraceae bacterium]|nr:hypothetical protein [Phycisphaeraceae bacterium]
MAGRLNTKFLIILVVAVVIILGGGLGLYALAAYRSIEERMTEADAFMEAGEYAAAAREYGKIVHKTNDIEALKKFFDATRMVKVAYGPPAHAAFNQLLGAINQAVREAPGDAEIFARNMEIYMQLGLELSQIGSWTQMYDRANQTLEAAPDMMVARKYRGIAQVNRMRSGLNLEDVERRLAREDLEAYLELKPDDVEAIFHLAVGYMVEAQYQEVRPNAVESEVRKLRDKGIALTDQARLLNPQDPGRGLDHIRVLLMAERPEQADPIVRELEQQMLDHPGSRRDMLMLVDLIGLTEPEEEEDENLPSAEKLAATMARRKAMWERRHHVLVSAVEALPDDLVVKVAYGRNVAQRGDSEEARRAFQEIGDIEVRQPALEAFLQTHAQQMAAISLANLILNDAEKIERGPEREEALASAETMLKEMREFIGEASAHYYLLYGKLHSLREEWIDAAQHLRKSNDQFRGANAEVLLRLATALAKNNQGGAAIQTLQQLLGIEGLENYKPALYELVKLFIRHKQFDDAQAQIDALLEDDPDDKACKQLQLALTNARGDADKTIEELKQLDPDDPNLQLRIASVLLNADRTVEAKAILDKEFAARPDDATVLSLIVKSVKDNEEVLGYVEKAKAAGLQDQWVLDLEKQLRGEAQPFDIAMSRIDALEDPFRQHVARFSLYRRFNEREKAKAEFAKAKSLQPEDPWIIEMAFNQAVAEGDWVAAQKLSQDAARLNLDRAQGLFYFGRLELAKGEYARAATSLREALSKRPDFDMGWRLLGEAQQAALDPGAIHSYRRAVELKPDNIDALRGLAAAHAARDEHDLALDQLKKALDYDPDNRNVRAAYIGYVQRHGDKEEALTLRRELVESDEDDLMNRRQLALLLAELENHDEAKTTLEALIEKDGVTRINVVTQAKLIEMAGDPKAADAHLEAYVKDLGDDVTMDDYLVLGRFRLDQDRMDAAGSAYKKAIGLEDPGTRPATREWAARLFTANDLEKAGKLYEQLYELNPSDRSNTYRYIELLLRSDVDKAASLLEKLMEDQGPDDMAWLLQSLVYSRRGKLDQALESLDQAMKLAPDRAVIHVQRAQLYASMNRVGEAQSAVNRALQLAPSNMQARLLFTQLLRATGEKDEAINELLQILKGDNELPDARLQLAGLYVETERLLQARRVLDESMEMFPEDWRWPYQLSKLDRREGRPTRAAQRLKKAFELGPTADLLSELVVAQIIAKRPEEALDTLRDNPEWVEQYPLLNSPRGWALGELDRLPEATQAFKKAIGVCQSLRQLRMVAGQMARAMGPSKASEVLESSRNDDNEILVTFVLAQFDLDDHNFNSVVERLQAIEGKVGMDSQYRHRLDDMLSIALHQVGRYPEAKAAYERLIAQNPGDIQSLNNLAYLVGENLGDPQGALVYIRKAVERLPNNAQILDTLGWMLFLADQKTEAEQTLRKSVDVAKMPANCYHLAHVLDDLGVAGTRQEAIDWARRSKRLAERFQDRNILEKATELLERLEPDGSNP